MTVSVLATVAASVAALIAATLLLRAGLEKIIDLRATAATLSALGVPPRLAGLAAPSLPLSEVATALGVLFAPDSPWTQAALVALGSAFALVGLAALLRKQRIRCNCFGSGTPGGFLGRAQVLALPAWVGAALILHYGIRQNLALETRALLFAAAGLTIATLKVPALWRQVREAYGDRISAQEMYAWLPPR
jgi:hypothetical protein